MKIKWLGLLLGSLVLFGSSWAEDREDAADRRDPPVVREGDRREGGDRPPPRDVRREGDRREDGDRGVRPDSMIDGLRRELGRMREQNAALRRHLQLLEQRLSKLEKK